MKVKELIVQLAKLDPEAVIHVTDPYSDYPDDFLLDDESPVTNLGDWVVLRLGDRTEAEEGHSDA